MYEPDGAESPPQGGEPMSTQGVIARAVADGWEGCYHQFDSYPEGLGKTLWRLYHGHSPATCSTSE